MTEIVSIDPGTEALGWAVWRHGRLWRAGVSRSVERERSPEAYARYHAAAIGLALDPDSPPEAVALESMEWRHGDVRSQPRDLLAVQTVGCLVAGRLGGFVHLYPPSRWKGTIPKDIHHERIKNALDANERAVLDQALAGVRASNRKEVLDAVGLGLYHLRRTNRSGGERV